MAGGRHHGLILCSDGPALYALLEAGPSHFRLGAEIRRTFQAKGCSPRTGRGNSGGADMKAIYGLYGEPAAAELAYKELRRAGVSENEITVMSSEPLEEYEFGRADRTTVMPWIAAVGAG